MPTREIKLLVLRRMSDAEVAFRAGCELDEEVWRAFGPLTADWIDEGTWTGDYSDPTETLKIAPRAWTRSENDETKYIAQFLLDAGPGDDWDRETPSIDAFWLQRLCGIGRGVVGFRWLFEYREHGFGKAEWRAFVRSYVEQLSASTGFKFEEKEGHFFLPVKISLDELVRAYEGDAIEDALKPINVALDMLARAAPEFQKLIDAAVAFKSMR